MKVTVDIVLFKKEAKGTISLLLIERKNDPFKGTWALPGGFVVEDESLESAAKRELKEETGIDVPNLEQLYTFGEPNRDPRGRTLSVAHVGHVTTNSEPQGGDDAAKARWFSLHQLPALAFDHAAIIKMARERKNF